MPVGIGTVLLAALSLVVGGLLLPAMAGSGPSSFASPPLRNPVAPLLGSEPALGAMPPSPATISPAATSYRVVFNETTLPGGTGFSDWAVQLGGGGVGDFARGPGTQLAFSMTNGTYAFMIIPVSGYLPRPPSGSVYVAGANQTVQIVFQPAPVYPLTFRETGLPAGGFWYVNMYGTSIPSHAANHTYLVSNGTYPFTLGPGYAGNGSILYQATPSSGTVVINGSGANFSLTFSVPQYLLTFAETGLPSGTDWRVCVTNVTPGSPCTRFGGGLSIVTWVPNGTYGFTVEPLIGFTANPSSGTVTIAGAPATTTIAFRLTNPRQYAVVFNETGLPASANWTVTLNGTAASSATSSVVVGEPNGTYAFAVPAVTSSSTRYNATPAQGNVTVAGAAVLVKVTFSNSSTVRAASPLRILLFQVSPADLAIGQQVTVSVTTAGGTGPLTYIYTGVPVGCAAADRATWTCTPTSVGTSRLAVQVRDASGTSSSAQVTLVVHGGTSAGPAVSLIDVSAVGVGLLVVLGLAGVVALWSRRSRGGSLNEADAENPYRVGDLAFGVLPAEGVGPEATRTPTPTPPADDPLGDLA